ncbi:MAG: FAD:protein FMN transferase [Peptococcaceae bacterium]|nr:FAD:protein FMN transferase [Peptococcaceae bacterium]
MKRLFIGGLLVAALMLAGCSAQTSAEEPSQSREVYAMDTVMTLEAYGQNADAALDEAVAEIERLDALWSIASSDGEIAQLNAEKKITASADTLALLTCAKEISAATDGLFSTTIAPLMEAWGFTSGNYRVPDEAELSALLAHVDDEEIAISDSTVTIPADAEVDLGGIAKGFTSARVMEIFRENGVENGILSLGGNVQALGTKPDGTLWRVGLQDPADERALFATLELADKAVITSGAYERNFEQDGITYHHIIDPRTGYPAESGLSSVTIVSDDGTLADGLSTALYIMGKEAAVEFWRSHRDDFDMVLLADDGAVTVSAGIADALTLSDGSAAEVVS